MNLRITVCVFLTAAVLTVGCGNKQVAQTPAPPSLSTNRFSPLPSGHPPIGDSSTIQLPPGHPNIDMASEGLPPGSVPDAATPRWTVPANWKAGRVSSMRKGSFSVSNTEGQNADIAVTVFSGDVGGFFSNLNRWRSQIGLSPATLEEAANAACSIEIDGIKSKIVDIATEKAPEGAKNPVRMIVVSVQRDRLSWFFKMTGDAPLVTAQKEAFLGFVKSIKF